MILTRSRWLTGEPRISDLMNDPLTRAIMDRDGVSDDDLLETIRRARLAMRWRQRVQNDIMDNAA